MDLPIRIGIICNMKYRHAIRLRFGDKFLTSLAKLVLEAKTSICFTIRKIYFYIIASCLTSFKQYFNCPSDKPLFTNQESSYAYFCLKQELFFLNKPQQKFCYAKVRIYLIQENYSLL